jgi:hypothetical protein
MPTFMQQRSSHCRRQKRDNAPSHIILRLACDHADAVIPVGQESRRQVFPDLRSRTWLPHYSASTSATEGRCKPAILLDPTRLQPPSTASGGRLPLLFSCSINLQVQEPTLNPAFKEVKEDVQEINAIAALSHVDPEAGE